MLCKVRARWWALFVEIEGAWCSHYFFQVRNALNFLFRSFLCPVEKRVFKTMYRFDSSDILFTDSKASFFSWERPLASHTALNHVLITCSLAIL